MDETVRKYHFQVAVKDVTEVNAQLVVIGRVFRNVPGQPGRSSLLLYARCRPDHALRDCSMSANSTPAFRPRPRRRCWGRSHRHLGGIPLALMGWKDIVLLERDRLTSGTTWHAAGLMVTFGSTSETSTEMRKYSRALYGRLEAETGNPRDSRQSASSKLHPTRTGSRSIGVSQHSIAIVAWTYKSCRRARCRICSRSRKWMTSRPAST